MRQIETSRLLLREFVREDLDDLYLIRSDPLVMRYIGTGQASTREQVEATINHNLEIWEQHEFGRWAVTDKRGGRLLGWCGLTFLDTTPEIEIGYGIAREHWGRGITTEAARAALRHGFEELKLNRIVAVAMPENAASWRVMEKLGMRFEKQARYYNSDVVYYAIKRAEFRPGDALYIYRADA